MEKPKDIPTLWVKLTEDELTELAGARYNITKGKSMLAELLVALAIGIVWGLLLDMHDLLIGYRAFWLFPAAVPLFIWVWDIQTAPRAYVKGFREEAEKRSELVRGALDYREGKPGIASLTYKGKDN